MPLSFIESGSYCCYCWLQWRTSLTTITTVPVKIIHLLCNKIHQPPNHWILTIHYGMTEQQINQIQIHPWKIQQQIIIIRIVVEQCKIKTYHHQHHHHRQKHHPRQIIITTTIAAPPPPPPTASKCPIIRMVHAWSPFIKQKQDLVLMFVDKYQKVANCVQSMDNCMHHYSMYRPVWIMVLPKKLASKKAIAFLKCKWRRIFQN